MEYTEIKDLSKETIKEVVELYNDFVSEIQPLLNSEDKKEIEYEIYWKTRHISSYEMLDTFSDDYIVVNIITDNNNLQGIRCYIELDEKGIPTNIMQYVDIYLNDDDYPFEDVDIATLKEMIQ